MCSHIEDATAPSDWLKGAGMVWSALLWPAVELQEEAAWTLEIRNQRIQDRHITKILTTPNNTEQMKVMQGCCDIFLIS